MKCQADTAPSAIQPYDTTTKPVGPAVTEHNTQHDRTAQHRWRNAIMLTQYEEYNINTLQQQNVIADEILLQMRKQEQDALVLNRVHNTMKSSRNAVVIATKCNNQNESLNNKLARRNNQDNSCSLNGEIGQLNETIHDDSSKLLNCTIQNATITAQLRR